MPVLTKIIVNSNNDINHVIPVIKQYLIKNPNYKGFIISNYFGKIYTEYDNFIPQMFISHIVYISAKSFQQNNLILGNNIRKYVYNIINNKSYQNITCIGGESYIYGLISNIMTIYHYTNNMNIYKDCEYNTTIDHNIYNTMIDYNKIINLIKTDLCIINCSNLNKNLIQVINKTKYDKLVIINCHHVDFWKKIKLLSNYKLIKREQFICNYLKYFITVNIFQLIKNRISLGGNCSVA
jgi:hypothetical protein